MTDRLICAWLSRHAATIHQRHSLWQYDIVQINPPNRFRSADHAWSRACRDCHRKPDLFVVVLPDQFLLHFLELVAVFAPHVPVLQARMLPPAYQHWSGEWRAFQMVNGNLTWYSWKPEPLS
ncbi:MAG: hypothetical protein IPK17_38625 [Chloroflexi bacterium]|uniref:hypothetical protein n=1 Tax=Candidatus Flexifilum breve TaxID=3140694 RepID=UPI003134A972|nr:hypothetical protein [Chloroflexota bacterium]